MDISSKDGVKTVFNGSKSVGEAAFDATADVVAGKVGGAIGKKVTGFAEKSLAKATASEAKAVRGLVKASNLFNKVTDGGRNLGGVRGTIVSNKLDIAKSAVNRTRNLAVATGVAKKVSGGVLGKIINKALQNAATDKIKNKN